MNREIKNLIEQYNNLNGKVTSREDLKKYYLSLFDYLPESEIIREIRNKIGNLLDSSEVANHFNITLKDTFLEYSENELAGLGVPFIENDSHLQTGLNKAVTPNEIYNMITEMVIEMLESENAIAWHKPWTATGSFGESATNLKTKTVYRGINDFLLNVVAPYRNGKPFNSQFFLSFKQMQDLGGTLNEGSKGHVLIYYSKVHSITQEEPKLNFRTTDTKKFNAFIKKNKNKITDKAVKSSFSILKYFKVFSLDGIKGIEIPKVEKAKETEFNNIKVAEAIIKNMPNAPKLKLESAADAAFYWSTDDSVTMPKKSFFDEEQFYYSVFFHELIHATGNRKRLARSLGNKFGSTAYAFEELIAEFGALFLCSEAGILYKTIDNSTAYIKGWKKGLIKNAKEDNKFIFRAVSKSQAAADYILDRNDKGEPKYLKALTYNTKIHDEIFEENRTKTPILDSDIFKEVSELTNLEIKKIGKEYASNILWSDKVNTYIKKIIVEKNKRASLKDDKQLALGLKGSWHNKNSKYKHTTDDNQKLRKGYRFLKNGTIKNIKTGRIYKGDAPFPYQKKEGKSFVKKSEKKIVKEEKKVITPKKGEITILKTSPKGAMLITDGEKTTWIMPRQKRKDGSFTPGALTALKNGQDYKTKEEYVKSKITEKYIKIYSDFKETKTGKAIYTNVTISEYVSDQALMRRMFIPKSLVVKQTNSYVIVPKWFFDKKEQELFDDVATSAVKVETLSLEITTETPANEDLKGLVKGLNGLEKSDWKSELKGLEQIQTTFQESFFNEEEEYILQIPPLETIPEIPVVFDEVIPGLNAPEKEIAIAKPIVKGKNIDKKGNPFLSSAERLNKPKKEANLYNLKNDELSKFLGRIEIKPKHSLVITLDSGEGGGKTHTCYQFAHAFAESGYKSIIWSLEEHVESNLSEEKQEKYFDVNTKQIISVESDETEFSDEENFKRIIDSLKYFDVILVDSLTKMLELNNKFNLDKDLRKAFNGKLIVLIIQRTADGKMRGGSKSGFDGDIILKVNVDRGDFRNNYIFNHKNRYNSYMPISDLQYSPFYQKLVGQEEEEYILQV